MVCNPMPCPYLPPVAGCGEDVRCPRWLPAAAPNSPSSAYPPQNRDRSLGRAGSPRTCMACGKSCMSTGARWSWPQSFPTVDIPYPGTCPANMSIYSHVCMDTSMCIILICGHECKTHHPTLLLHRWEKVGKDTENGLTHL